MWAKLAEEMKVPWRAAEAMHWQIGEAGMASRAGVVPFSLATVNSEWDTTQTSLPFGIHDHRYTQGTILHAPIAPPPRALYHTVSPMAANSQAIIPYPNSTLPSLPLPMEPDLEEVQ